jgi:hypothetical protein
VFCHENLGSRRYGTNRIRRLTTCKEGCSGSESTERVQGGCSSIKPNLAAKEKAGQVETEGSQKQGNWEMNKGGMQIW